MSSIAELIPARVATGAAVLDQHDPGWWKPGITDAIDLDTLDLTHPAHCVLGQRCPLSVLDRYRAHPDPEDRYYAYLRELTGSDADGDWASENGFTLSRWSSSDFGSHDDWAALTAAWKRLIAERRSAA